MLVTIFDCIYMKIYTWSINAQSINIIEWHFIYTECYGERYAARYAVRYALRLQQYLKKADYQWKIENVKNPFKNNIF